MTIPALLAVDDNPDTLKVLDDVLRHRYGHDYLILSEASPGTALGRLRELRAAGRPVAVMMAAAAMTATPGAEFLAQARGIQPTAKRVLVVPRGGHAGPARDGARNDRRLPAGARRRTRRGIPPGRQRNAGGVGSRRHPGPARG